MMDDWIPTRDRSKAPLLIEATDLDEEDLNLLCDFQQWIGKWTGGFRFIRDFMQGSLRRWNPGGPITVLDLYCGRGDLSRFITTWFRKMKWDVRILALDPNQQLIQIASKREPVFPEIVFESREISDPLFLQAQQFDFVIAYMGLHRESDARLVPSWKAINRLAKRGFVVMDWIRDPRAFYWMSFLGRIFADEDAVQDGCTSIRRGFRIREAGRLATISGAEQAVLKKHFGYQFSLSWERQLAVSREFSPVTGLAGT